MDSGEAELVNVLDYLVTLQNGQVLPQQPCDRRSVEVELTGRRPSTGSEGRRKLHVGYVSVQTPKNLRDLDLAPPRLVGWVHNGVAALRITLPPLAYLRDETQPLLNDKYILIKRFRDRPAYMRRGTRATVIRCGQIHIFDRSLPDAIATAGGRCDMILLPKVLLPDGSVPTQSHLRISALSSVGQLIGKAIDRLLPGVGPGGTGSAVAEALDNLCSLLGAVYRTLPARSGDGSVDRFEKIRSYAASHALDAGFGVADLCGAFRVSRATVYRAFEPYGGVNSFIQRTRLKRAFLRLWETPHQRGVVTRVARDHGFDDPYHFSRLIRLNYEISPSEVAAIDVAAAFRD